MKELLFSVGKKDFDIQTFCAGGAGGQHQNKTESGVRIVHKASGAVGESREEREQSRNKQTAFKRLTSSSKFQTWLKIKASEMMMEESIDQKIDRLMQDTNIKTEIKNEKGQWVQTKFPLIGDENA
jgi:protein subunit release factor B